MKTHTHDVVTHRELNRAALSPSSSSKLLPFVKYMENMRAAGNNCEISFIPDDFVRVSVFIPALMNDEKKLRFFFFY